jgi:hypothetical protein
MKTISQDWDSQPLDKDLNLRPSKYEEGMPYTLMTQLEGMRV